MGVLEAAEAPRRVTSPAARITHHLTALWQWLRAGLRRHSVALGLVLLACALGQMVTLAQSPHVVVDHDGTGYLQVAHAMLVQHQLLSPERTPGYPGLLALIFSVTGEHNLTAVTDIQAVLFVVSTLEIYALVCVVSRRRWMAATLAALVGANLYILNWERSVRDETLSLLVVVALFLALAVYVRTERRPMLGAFVALCLAMIMVRPAEVFLPAVLLGLLAVRGLRLGQLRRHWRRFALSAVLVYGVVGGFMVVNARAFGFFGLTDVVNINLFGKILEYRMQGESTSSQYAQLRTDADTFVQTSDPQGLGEALSPWVFVYGTWDGTPHYAYARKGFAALGAYGKDIILHHPFQYAVRSIPDILAGWDAPPTLFYAPYSATPTPILRLLTLARLELLSYLLIPIALAVLIVRVWRAPRDDAAFVPLLMILCAAVTLIVDAVASYAEYYRLREPLDWAVIVSVGLLALGALELVAVRLRPALEPEVYRLLARTGLLSSAPASSSARAASVPEAPAKQASRLQAPDTAPPQVDELDTFQMPITGFQTREIHRRCIPKPSPSKPQRPGRFQR